MIPSARTVIDVDRVFHLYPHALVSRRLPVQEYLARRIEKMKLERHHQHMLEPSLLESSGGPGCQPRRQKRRCQDEVTRRYRQCEESARDRLLNIKKQHRCAKPSHYKYTQPASPRPLLTLRQRPPENLGAHVRFV